MFRRMTDRAQNLKIFEAIVVSIAVFVMNTKYFWFRVVPATFAFNKHLPCYHRLTNGAKNWVPRFFFSFVNARPRAKFSLGRRRRAEFLTAMLTGMLHRTFARHAFVVANFTAIFGLVSSTSDMRKLIAALFAVSFVPHSRRQRLTRPTAIDGGIFSVVGYSKNCATVRALFINSFARSYHAAH